jgi:hypothetical protein
MPLQTTFKDAAAHLGISPCGTSSFSDTMSCLTAVVQVQPTPMLAVIAPSQPVAAVLATPYECCVVPKPSSLQHKEHQQASAQQCDVVNTQVLQQALSVSGNKQSKPMGAAQLHGDQGAGLSAVPASTGATAASSAAQEPSNAGSSLPSRRERRHSRTERRPSRSERKVAAAPVAGYSTDSYWNSRYAERSTHFDWFYNYSALAELISTACDSQAGPCLHVGCGNSGFSEGMVQDGFKVSSASLCLYMHGLLYKHALNMQPVNTMQLLCSRLGLSFVSRSPWLLACACHACLGQQSTHALVDCCA